eukprot:2025800-Rhodomonas_salina.4
MVTVPGITEPAASKATAHALPASSTTLAGAVSELEGGAVLHVRCWDWDEGGQRSVPAHPPVSLCSLCIAMPSTPGTDMQYWYHILGTDNHEIVLLRPRWYRHAVVPLRTDIPYGETSSYDVPVLSERMMLCPGTASTRTEKAYGPTRDFIGSIKLGLSQLR